MNEKMVFIGHSLGPKEIHRDIKKILGICKQLRWKKIIPVAPCLASLQYLDGENPQDRRIIFAINQAYLFRKCIDEYWLYDKHITEEIQSEIRIAQNLKIPIIPQDQEIERAVQALLPYPVHSF